MKSAITVLLGLVFVLVSVHSIAAGPRLSLGVEPYTAGMTLDSCRIKTRAAVLGLGVFNAAELSTTGQGNLFAETASISMIAMCRDDLRVVMFGSSSTGPDITSLLDTFRSKFVN